MFLFEVVTKSEAPIQKTHNVRVLRAHVNYRILEVCLYSLISHANGCQHCNDSHRTEPQRIATEASLEVRIRCGCL